ncbi:hypothetical protein F2Q70_00028387 [Brassica cretica]|uniref:F-box domain-containing protein n=1 Tax=Brassica cretica TaxID=69181 RepID=A0A3N6QFV5_BRACR|nr:hypothetical protein F2Q70_00028387 [Brassica cretica]KAF3577245.1 hypothetical protein DY000_02035302 [Brassica cretica]
MEQQFSLLPIDLTSEILFRLPAKSVGRFCCLSKLWLSITTDPRFIKSFGTTRPSLLLCSIKGHDMFVTHQSSMIRSYASSQPFHLYPMKVPGKSCYFSCMDYVHGLICIDDVKSKVPLVWNPTMGPLVNVYLLDKAAAPFREKNEITTSRPYHTLTHTTVKPTHSLILTRFPQTLRQLAHVNMERDNHSLNCLLHAQGEWLLAPCHHHCSFLVTKSFSPKNISNTVLVMQLENSDTVATVSIRPRLRSWKADCQRSLSFPYQIASSSYPPPTVPHVTHITDQMHSYD